MTSQAGVQTDAAAKGSMSVTPNWAQSESHSTNAATAADPVVAAPREPEQAGLTREELRRIILALIG